MNWSSCKVPTYSCQILIELEISRQILKKISEKSNFMKIHSVGSRWCSMRRHGQTDVKKLLVAFHNFAKLSNQSSANVAQNNTNCPTRHQRMSPNTTQIVQPDINECRPTQYKFQHIKKSC